MPENSRIWAEDRERAVSGSGEVKGWGPEKQEGSGTLRAQDSRVSSGEWERGC